MNVQELKKTSPRNLTSGLEVKKGKFAHKRSGGNKSWFPQLGQVCQLVRGDEGKLEGQK